jgi:hypothetical protein
LTGYESEDYKFIAVKHTPKLGIVILVGGEREKDSHALPVVKGFFIWAGIQFFDQILYSHDDYKAGAVRNHPDVLENAHQIGCSVATARHKFK